MDRKSGTNRGRLAVAFHASNSREAVHEIDGSANFHTRYMHGQPPGVECRSRGHHALAFDDGQGLETGKGNMRHLSPLRFVCRTCGWPDPDASAKVDADGCTYKRLPALATRPA